MYSNKILNFQESTILLNACPKMSGNLLKASHSFGSYTRLLRIIIDYSCGLMVLKVDWYTFTNEFESYLQSYTFSL